MQIKTFEFNERGRNDLLQYKHGKDWPVVYLLYNENEVYVGETTSREYKSFYKTVSGNEGQKCHYSTRLDTYGCVCLHDCKYCYAKSLLQFRNLWDPLNPSVADIKKIERKIQTLPKGTLLRLGGMTDCFQPCEKEYRVTYDTIKLLNKYGIHYLIVTKSDLVATNEYVSIMDRNLAHIQITVTSTDDKLAATYEHATPPSKRIKAIEKLEELGFDVQIRLSPFIEEFLDLEIINNIRCKKAIVEFLRVNTFIKNTFTSINYKKYTHKEGGYYHLELNEKQKLLKRITGFEQISICEDCSEAYEYWKNYVNYNKADCCNLQMNGAKENFRHIGDLKILQRKKVSFLSSRVMSETARISAKQWALRQTQTGDAVVSGFQSPLEKEVLDILLDNGGYAIIVMSNRIFNKCPPKYQQAVTENRLLITSYFGDEQIKTTRQSAEIRNNKVIEMADTIVVGCIKREGMIEKLINSTTKPCYVLDSMRIE